MHLIMYWLGNVEDFSSDKDDAEDNFMVKASDFMENTCNDKSEDCSNLVIVAAAGKATEDISGVSENAEIPPYQ